MLRRLLIAADTHGGAWSYSLQLSRLLSERGVSVVLAALGGEPRSDQRADVRRIRGIELVESRCRLEWTHDPWTDVERAGEWLLEVERRTAPDVVHLNGYGHAALAWRAPVLVAAHACISSWWRAVLGDAPPPVFDRYREVARRGVRAARAVVAPTRTMLDAVTEHYGAPDLGAVVPHAVDAAAYRPGRKQPFVFCASRPWDRAKNVYALCRAAPRLEWPVVVSGASAGPHGEPWAGPSVRALGWLGPDAVASWLARASIYAMPARYAVFGRSVLEAALSGCALVLGDIPSLREVWGDCAVYVDPLDDQAIERAIAAMIAEPARRNVFAERARERALTFSPDRMREGYESLYAMLLGAAGGAN